MRSPWIAAQEGRKAHERHHPSCLAGAPYVSAAEAEEFKYQLIIEGAGFYADRSSRMLFSGSTLLIPKTAWRCDEWFMQLMQPMVHYIPVDYELRNLSATLRWARANDALVRSIGENAFVFAKRYLNKRAILEYMHALISHMHR